MMKVYDETVPVKIERAGKTMVVPFSELQDGDKTIDPKYPQITCDGDAHRSGDADYDGFIVYGMNCSGYFPEDFGAKEKTGA